MVKSMTEVRIKKTKKKEKKSKTEKRDKKKEEKNMESEKNDNYKEDDTSVYKFMDMLENMPKENFADDECQNKENDPSILDFNFNTNNYN